MEAAEDSEGLGAGLAQPLPGDMALSLCFQPAKWKDLSPPTQPVCPAAMRSETQGRKGL